MTLFPLLVVLLASTLQTTPSTEVLSAIQVRGNVATPDTEVSALAGLTLGMPIDANTVTAAAERLRATKRFEHVDVLKRYASLSDPSLVVMVLIVDEGAVSITRTQDPDRPTRVVRRRAPKLLFFPILFGESGYGATYGVRLARPDAAGSDSRLSFPATWGGEKRIGAELEKRLTHSWLSRIETGAALTRTTNPFYQADDDRRAVWINAERQITPSLRVRGMAGWQSVSFQRESDRIADVGVEAVIDTRLDPFLARNAVFAKAGVSRLAFEQRNGLARADMEAHGYVGLLGQTILVASARTSQVSGPLPEYLKPLLGGPSSVRGFSTGTSAGDRLATGSLELRVPLTSPLSLGKAGVSAFIDAGKVYDTTERFADRSLARGVGGSVWFAAAFVRVNVAVAHGLGASTHVHVSGNLTF